MSKKILFGNGRYAMVSTDAHKRRTVIQAMHPHNMYLEVFLDAGLVGLLIILSLFGYLLLKSHTRPFESLAWTIRLTRNI
jgi:hypothetical protein